MIVGMDRVRQFIEENVDDQSSSISPEAEVEIESSGEPQDFEEDFVEDDGSDLGDPLIADGGEDSEPELVERDWYGRKIRIDKAGDEFINSYFTQKNQELMEKHRQEVEALSAKEAEAEEKLRRAEEIQSLMQAHLDANPEFAHSWNSDVSQREEQALLKQLKDKLDRIEAEKQREAQISRRRAEVQALESKYSLESEEDRQDLRDIALASWVKRGGKGSMEHDYQLAYSRISGRNKRGTRGKIRSAGRKARASSPVGSSRRRGTPKQQEQRPKGLKALLKEHLAMPDEFFR